MEKSLLHTESTLNNDQSQMMENQSDLNIPKRLLPSYLAVFDGLTIVIAIVMTVRPMTFLITEYSLVHFNLDLGILIAIIALSFIYGGGLFYRKKWSVPLGIITCIISIFEEGTIAWLALSFPLSFYYWEYYPWRGVISFLLLMYLLIPDTRRQFNLYNPHIETNWIFKSSVILLGIVAYSLASFYLPSIVFSLGYSINMIVFSSIVAVLWDDVKKLSNRS